MVRHFKAPVMLKRNKVFDKTKRGRYDALSSFLCFNNKYGENLIKFKILKYHSTSQSVIAARWSCYFVRTKFHSRKCVQTQPAYIVLGSTVISPASSRCRLSARSLISKPLSLSYSTTVTDAFGTHFKSFI